VKRPHDSAVKQAAVLYAAKATGIAQKDCCILWACSDKAEHPVGKMLNFQRAKVASATFIFHYPNGGFDLHRFS